MSDPINRPEHYTASSIECVDAIRAALTPEQFAGYCKGNIFKYLWRSDLKGARIQDCKKAHWYLQKLLESFYETDNHAK